jgi:CRP-like cAMP-binding protein
MQHATTDLQNARGSMGGFTPATDGPGAITALQPPRPAPATARVDATGHTPDGRADLGVSDRPLEANRLLRLLAGWAPADYEALLPQLEPIAHVQGAVLYEPDGPLPHVYFPHTGVASIIRIMADGRRVEVGTTGHEGMVGLPVFLGAETTPFQCVIQIPGSSWRMRATALHDLASRSVVLRAILQRYTQYLYDQAAHLVACNRLHSIDERCARWLLMTHDRVSPASRFALTQEFLAVMLGVRRASVSVAAESLQRDGRIRYHRGSITVVDRAGLESASCECYGSDRADYERLLGRSAAWDS